MKTKIDYDRNGIENIKKSRFDIRESGRILKNLYGISK